MLQPVFLVLYSLFYIHYSSALQQPIANKGKLHKVLSLAFGLSVSFAGIIGLGIFRTPGEVAEKIGNPTVFILLWIAGAVYAMIGVFSVAELGAMIPRSGGPYCFARRSMGPLPAFIIGWGDFLSWSAGDAAFLIILSEYLLLLFPSMGIWAKIIPLLFTCLFALLQWQGVLWGARLQKIAALVKAVFMLALIIIFFTVNPRHPELVNHTLSSPPVTFSAIMIALQSIIYTYDGWHYPTYFSEEISNPAKLPKAMIRGVLIVSVTYLILFFAMMHIMPVASMAGEKLVIGKVAQIVLGDVAGKLVNLIVIIFIISSMNLDYMIGSRILYAISSDKLGVNKAATVNKGGTPNIALFITWASIVFFTVTGSFDFLISVLSIIFVFTYSMLFLSVILLREKEPELHRPYKAWGYPYTTIFSFIASIAFLGAVVKGDPKNSLYALLLMMFCVPVYFLLKAINKS